VTEPTRCLGRSERHALQLAHDRYPAGFEIVGWKRVRPGLRSPVEVAIRPIFASVSRERARLRLLACVNGLQHQQAQNFSAHHTPTIAIEPVLPVDTFIPNFHTLSIDACMPSQGKRSVWAFVGAPGSGVSRVVSGLATRLHGRDRCTVGLISAGDEGHAAGLRQFADASGLPMHAAVNAHSLAAAAASLGHRGLVLVDFPGCGPRDGDRLVSHARALESLAATEVCAVLPADADELVMQRQLEVFVRLGATHIVLSRVDLAARLQPALRAMLASGLPLAWIAHGCTTLGDLSPATHDWVARVASQHTVLV